MTVCTHYRLFICSRVASYNRVLGCLVECVCVFIIVSGLFTHACVFVFLCVCVCLFVCLCIRFWFCVYLYGFVFMCAFICMCWLFVYLCWLFLRVCANLLVVVLSNVPLNPMTAFEDADSLQPPPPCVKVCESV